jgi:hypothetical protein
VSEEVPASFSAEGSSNLLGALRRILRPIVKLMLSQGLPIQHASGLLKQVYFDVASAEIEALEKRASDSRLSLMTGINRKELKRLRASAQRDDEVPHSVSLGVQLVSHWISTPRFLDAEERPLALPRASRAAANESDADAAASFDELVSSVSRDVHARSVLEELIRLGVVEVDSEKRVQLLTSAFVPRSGFDEKLYYFGQNGHDHLDAAVRNIKGDDPPLMERSVHYDNLRPDDVNLLSRFAEQEGMKLLETLNRMARELRAEEADEKAERMNFGLYFYRGNDTRQAQPDALSDEHSDEGGSDA